MLIIETMKRFFEMAGSRASDQRALGARALVPEPLPLNSKAEWSREVCQALHWLRDRQDRLSHRHAYH